MYGARSNIFQTFYCFFSCSVAFDNPKHISYSWYILIVGFILPLVIIVVTSIFILVRVKQVLNYHLPLY